MPSICYTSFLRYNINKYKSLPQRFILDKLNVPVALALECLRFLLMLKFPCFRIPEPKMSTKMSQDAKKDEFRKYLEKAGVLELLTKSLVSLYEVGFHIRPLILVELNCIFCQEPEKPSDALNYLKKTVGGSQVLFWM